VAQLELARYRRSPTTRGSRLAKAGRNRITRTRSLRRPTLLHLDQLTSLEALQLPRQSRPYSRVYDVLGLYAAPRRSSTKAVGKAAGSMKNALIPLLSTVTKRYPAREKRWRHAEI
jgi:hypothetical protein